MWLMIPHRGMCENQCLSLLRQKPCYYLGCSRWQRRGSERENLDPAEYVFSLEVKGEVITVKWKRDNAAPSRSRYPEIEFSFDFLNISADTVRAMLRDMEVPDSLANAVMTRISANAT